MRAFAARWLEFREQNVANSLGPAEGRERAPRGAGPLVVCAIV